MIDDATFQNGISIIGTAVRQVADAATQGVYLDVFTKHMDSEEWMGFCRWAADTTPWVIDSRYRTFPSVPELHDALRRFRGERPVLVEATEAYERVQASSTYHPEAGTTWNYREIREKCGEAAARAFLAAGGSAAFASSWDEAKRRERFVAEYAETVRESPTSKLLPAPTAQKALPAAEADPALPPSREEAAAIVERVREAAGEKVKPKREGVTRVVRTDARDEELARQREAILADAPQAETAPVGAKEE